MLDEERLSAIEVRLAALEVRLGAPPHLAAASRQSPPAPTPSPPPGPADTSPVSTSPIRAAPQRVSRFSAALLLGWTGAASLVLAGAYLIKLGIASGWLTPERQLAGAALLGIAMIGGGLVLRANDRPYSSLLAAAGIAVLYLTIFGAHLLHDMIDSLAASALVIGVAALSLALHALFRASSFVAFALIGSYVCPLLIPIARGAVLDLAIYLTVWNVVYSVYALWIARRIVYLAALYASLLIFDSVWRGVLGGEEWEFAALFQLAQFDLFTLVVILFSLRHRRPLTMTEALAHLPALLLFYGVEYDIVQDHDPAAAPWAAIGFALTLYAGYLIARARLGRRDLPSLVLVNVFGAIVLFQAVYLNLVAGPWRPLVALVLALGLLAAPRLRAALGHAYWPYTCLAVLLFFAGYGELLWNWNDRTSVGEIALILLYPISLYLWYFAAKSGTAFIARLFRLAIAHVQLLAACGMLIYRVLGEAGAADRTAGRLWLSLSWALVGTFFLVVARVRDDRLLARSTLAIFALFAAKVLLFDLSGATALVRVGCLVILGVSLYLGGWIYRRIFEPSASFAATPIGDAPPSPPVVQTP